MDSGHFVGFFHHSMISPNQKKLKYLGNIVDPIVTQLKAQWLLARSKYIIPAILSLRPPIGVIGPRKYGLKISHLTPKIALWGQGWSQNRGL